MIDAAEDMTNEVLASYLENLTEQIEDPLDLFPPILWEAARRLRRKDALVNWDPWDRVEEALDDDDLNPWDLVCEELIGWKRFGESAAAVMEALEKAVKYEVRQNSND